jgi:hypothetical protein
MGRKKAVINEVEVPVVLPAIKIRVGLDASKVKLGDNENHWLVEIGTALGCSTNWFKDTNRSIAYMWLRDQSFQEQVLHGLWLSLF